MEIVIEKRKRGRPRKETTNVTTTQMVLIQPKSVIKQKEIENRIEEIRDILDEHRVRHKKEMEIFYGRVEKLKNKLESDHYNIVEHYEEQLSSLTTQIVKERTRQCQEGMIFVYGVKFGIITRELSESDYREDRYYVKYKNIITTGLSSKSDYLWLDETSKMKVLCHISKFKERCEQYGLKPTFNKRTCILLYEKMYGVRFDDGEFQYSLLEQYGLVTK